MVRNILFLCTGNSARSIMAEAYMNHASNKNWHAYSAGYNPNGKVNSFGLGTLKKCRYQDECSKEQIMGYVFEFSRNGYGNHRM